MERPGETPEEQQQSSSRGRRGQPPVGEPSPVTLSPHAEELLERATTAAERAAVAAEAVAAHGRGAEEERPPEAAVATPPTGGPPEEPPVPPEEPAGGGPFEEPARPSFAQRVRDRIDRGVAAMATRTGALVGIVALLLLIAAGVIAITVPWQEDVTLVSVPNDKVPEGAELLGQVDGRGIWVAPAPNGAPAPNQNAAPAPVAVTTEEILSKPKAEFMIVDQNDVPLGGTTVSINGDLYRVPEGGYLTVRLDPGTYSIWAQKPGYGQVKAEAFQVTASGAYQKFTLQPL
ncbi:MAG: carboxypeptidase-like regulatory domain-containing protein [Candidatus Yanofskybacteria bacterium]|nr:carboxypeptidase-like regulatory domain-containing protein [Candidatus Yanofskybacteria bacterium]